MTEIINTKVDTKQGSSIQLGGETKAGAAAFSSPKKDSIKKEVAQIDTKAELRGDSGLEDPLAAHAPDESQQSGGMFSDVALFGPTLSTYALEVSINATKDGIVEMGNIGKMRTERTQLLQENIYDGSDQAKKIVMSDVWEKFGSAIFSLVGGGFGLGNITYAAWKGGQMDGELDELSNKIENFMKGNRGGRVAAIDEEIETLAGTGTPTALEEGAEAGAGAGVREVEEDDDIDFSDDDEDETLGSVGGEEAGEPDLRVVIREEEASRPAGPSEAPVVEDDGLALGEDEWQDLDADGRKEWLEAKKAKRAALTSRTSAFWQKHMNIGMVVTKLADAGGSLTGAGIFAFVKAEAVAFEQQFKGEQQLDSQLIGQEDALINQIPGLLQQINSTAGQAQDAQTAIAQSAAAA